MVSVSVDSPRQDSVVVEAGDWTPADGFREGGKCYQNTAFVGPHEVDCKKWGPLPKKVKECAAGVVIAAFAAYFTRNPVAAAAATTAAGCGAAAF